jgi:monoamine oxidase
LKTIEEVYPGIRKNYERGFVKVWDRDPWARGAVAYLLPGQVSSLEPHIARPEGRIHFAGEHASKPESLRYARFLSQQLSALPELPKTCSPRCLKA